MEKCCKLPKRGLGGAPATKVFLHTYSPENVPGGNNYGYCLANSRTFRTNVIFWEFPGTGNFPIKIPGLSRRRGNLFS